MHVLFATLFPAPSTVCRNIGKMKGVRVRTSICLPFCPRTLGSSCPLLPCGILGSLSLRLSTLAFRWRCLGVLSTEELLHSLAAQNMQCLSFGQPCCGAAVRKLLTSSEQGHLCFLAAAQDKSFLRDCPCSAHHTLPLSEFENYLIARGPWSSPCMGGFSSEGLIHREQDHYLLDVPMVPKWGPVCSIVGERGQASPLLP